MRTRTIIASVSLLSVLVAGIVAAVIWLRPAKVPLPTPEPVAVPSQPEVLMLPTDPAWCHLVDYRHDGPPPWPRGNSMWLGANLFHPRGLWVGNMHAENFDAAVGQFKLETVQVRRIGKNGCVIIDPRIPPEWFGNK